MMYKHSHLLLSSPNVGELIVVSNNDDFEFWCRIVWKMLIESYEKLKDGLLSYRGQYNIFHDLHPLLKIVIDKNKNLLACATYKRIEGSLKLNAIGCDGTEVGKKALQQIIVDDIKHSELYYWAEVSGTIEHYFKKYNGYPMPNTLASEILNISSREIHLSKNDKVHYSRRIGDHKYLHEKMIFGIKNDDIFKKAIEEVEDYTKFMEECNRLYESMDEDVKKIKRAIYIIENIYRLHEENGFNELIPSWNKSLHDSIRTIESYLGMGVYDEVTLNDYIKYGRYLVEDMTVLELHKL